MGQYVEHLVVVHGLVTGGSVGYAPVFFPDPESGEDGIPGAPGARGPTGLTGPQGLPGVAVIVESEVDDPLPGAPGPIGPTGATGATGPQGSPSVAVMIDAEPGEDGFPGMLGPKGEQGLPGVALMIEGEPGTDGFPGTIGPAGPQGAPGISLMIEGEPGEDGQPIQGNQGITGTTGAQGPMGPTLIVESEPGEDAVALLTYRLPTVNDIPSFSALATLTGPALADVVPAYSFVAGTNRSVPLFALGGLFSPTLCDFRLSLVSGDPCPSADQTAKTTLYLTPLAAATADSNNIGSRVCLFTGDWRMYVTNELSLALGTLTSGLPYDVFLFDNSGTLNLALVAWTNGTTRNIALALLDGVLVRSDLPTRRYIGTIYTTSTTTTEDSATKRFVYNHFNQRSRRLFVTESASNWTYSSATARAANNSTANRVEVVIGVPNTMVDLFVSGKFSSDTTVGCSAVIGEDSTSAALAGQIGQDIPVNAGTFNRAFSRVTRRPDIGYHYYQWIEAGGGSGTQSHFGQSLSGIVGTVDS